MSLVGVEPLVEALVEFHDAIRSPVTKGQYDRDLALFLAFTKTGGSSLEEKTNSFIARAKVDSIWTTTVVNDYIRNLKARVEKGEIYRF